MTDQGCPFFVMEYVKGVPITEYCDQAKITVEGRLRLLVEVCHAVQHAHQKGIIHRDLKPSNILICLYDGQPVPKVIDFGLAKAMYQPLTDQTLYTGHALMVGTPLYMSPEQAEFNNLDVDTRSDIYSLGVILYELLTGTTPLDRQRFKDTAWLEMVRLIKEEEPKKPSTRLSGSGSLPAVAAQRGLDPVQLMRVVRGDLDWIVMKCLEKERSRRYETANGLARDLQRYLADEVVEARPPSAGYRLRKFVRRNRGLVVAVALIVLVLVAGIAGTTWGMIRAVRANVEAQEQRVKAEAAASAERAAKERAQQIEVQRQAEYAASLVDELSKAQMGEVPGIVQQIGKIRPLTDPLLRQEDALAPEKSEKKLRLALALLPVEPGKVEDLRDELFRVTPTEFFTVRDALSPYTDSVLEPLWNAALDTKREAQIRFQAACALATYAPTDRRWSSINTFVAGRLVTLETSALVQWREALRPANEQLLKPLGAIFRDTTQEKVSRSFAAETLADYAARRPEELFNLLVDAEQFQFPLLFAKLAVHKDKIVALARKEFAKRPPEKATEDEKELLAKRQANAAVALFELGAPEWVWPLLKFSPDPRVRSYIIHCASPLGADPRPILERLDGEPDVTIRRALVLTLGQFSDSQLSMAQRQPLIEKLLTIFETQRDAGLHGAAEWLLRRWGQGKRLDAIVEKLKTDEKQLRSRKASDKRQWYVNAQKQTFVVVDAGEFLMGSPDCEPDRFPNESPRHLRRIGRRFAISAYEVTKAQYRVFERAAIPGSLANYRNYYVRTDDSPQTGVTWFDAAHYCNWLSEQEGIPREQWCFEPNDRGVYGPGMKAKDGYLQLTGYRLPTEAEWEYACRAGTLTSRYYGQSEGLLPKYAWYVANSHDRTWPVGGLKPNDWGLFDMEGNAWEWCFNVSVGHYPQQTAKVVDSVPTAQPITVNVFRVLRGGSFGAQPSSVRSANRGTYARPVDRLIDFGFRPARTYP